MGNSLCKLIFCRLTDADMKNRYKYSSKNSKGREDTNALLGTKICINDDSTDEIIYDHSPMNLVSKYVHSQQQTLINKDTDDDTEEEDDFNSNATINDLKSIVKKANRTKSKRMDAKTEAAFLKMALDARIDQEQLKKVSNVVRQVKGALDKNDAASHSDTPSSTAAVTTTQSERVKPATCNIVVGKSDDSDTLVKVKLNKKKRPVSRSKQTIIAPPLTV